ncbi:MAG: L-threonylcarbamoyladenylate synthase [Pseudomonadota bacterium]
MSLILRINPKEPEAAEIAKAVEFLQTGEVVAYPTETIFGLGADVFNKKAIKKIYDLKSRDYGLPISILIADIPMLRQYVKEVPDHALRLMRKFWPGPLTICFPASEEIPKGLVTNTGRVGVRLSSHPVAAALVKVFGKAITTTSANLSGYPPALSVKHIQKYFGEKIPCIIDAGECDPSKGSTVVDVGEDTMRIIREGSIPADEVIKCFQDA